MVHCFSFDNDYYLYDVASGSLHKCDALTCQVINKMQGLPYDFAGVDSSVTDESEKEIPTLIDDIIYTPSTAPEFQSSLLVIPLQLLSYHTAKLLERDIDKPKNLAKSVTVE